MDDNHRGIVGADSAAAEIYARLRRQGLRSLVRKAFEYLKHQSDTFDKANGTNTSGIEPVWRLNINSPNKKFAIRYESGDSDALRETILVLGIDPAAYTFIDLGCGKGRQLLVAAACGFRRVVGVEFSAKLTKIARRNASIMKFENIEVVTGDAAAFQFDDPRIVIYMFNPFTAEVMSRVLYNLHFANLAELIVIYENPSCAEILRQSHILTEFGLVQGRRYPLTIWKKS